MTKKEMFKQILRVLKPFVDMKVPDEWPKKCILTFDDDAVCYKTKKPFVSMSYLPETDDNDENAPMIQDWRKLQILYEKIKKEIKNVKSKT